MTELSGFAIAGARVRRDETSTSWREPADRDKARQQLAQIRRGELDVDALGGDETSHLTRTFWTQDLNAALYWRDHARWTPTGYPNLDLLSPRPPETLHDWSPGLRERHGLAHLYDTDQARLREVRRVSHVQSDAYAASEPKAAQPKTRARRVIG
jgi:hypothetical protein